MEVEARFKYVLHYFPPNTHIHTQTHAACSVTIRSELRRQGANMSLDRQLGMYSYSIPSVSTNLDTRTL